MINYLLCPKQKYFQVCKRAI